MWGHSTRYVFGKEPKVCNITHPNPWRRFADIPVPHMCLLAGWQCWGGSSRRQTGPEDHLHQCGLKPTVLDWCKSSPINTSTIARRCPHFPLRRVVAHCTEVSGIRLTYLRTRAKDVVAMFGHRGRRKGSRNGRFSAPRFATSLFFSLPSSIREYAGDL